MRRNEKKELRNKEGDRVRNSSFTSREPLIEAALDEFITYDYDKASLNRIIKSAGISKGTFYYHFKNKEELYKHLLVTGVKQKWLYINEYTKDHQVDFEMMDIFDKFLYQAKAGTIYAHDHPKYHKLGNMFAKEKGNAIYDAIINEVGGDSTDMLREMVGKAYESGELDQSFSEEFLLKLLHNMFSNYDEVFKGESELEHTLKNLEDYVRFMKQGIKAK